ncbi:MAG: right-handed parallel beta-helix repeat-containing protein [Planctomycetota bacterium]
MRRFSIPGILLVTLLTTGSWARGQELNPETGETTAPSFSTVTPVTDSLGLWGKYVPRFGFRYDTGDSIGRRGGLSSFQGFVPLLESADQNRLTFSDLRLLLDSEGANLGANVGVGHRIFVERWMRTVGGYLYYDNRNTGSATFNQFSGGLESLGEIWDARTNFYIPLGNDRELVAGAVDPNFQFQGHYLVASTLGLFETAMAGFDYEAGPRLFSISGVDVRWLVGGYHFQGQYVPQAWGWKTRIEGVVADNLALSLSIQNDRVFDTTVNLAAAVYFPRRSARRWEGPRDLPVRDRLAEPIERIQTIVVDRSTSGAPATFAIDPATGQRLFFVHVADGGNSNGTVEDPYGTLAEAAGDSQVQNGGVIVYDHRKNAVEAANLNFATNNKILSAGPKQVVNTQFGPTVLPFSGTGVNSTLLGSMTVGSNSLISGFAIQQVLGLNALTINGGGTRVENSSIAHNGSGSAIAINAANGLTSFVNTPVTHSGNGALVNIQSSNGRIEFVDSNLEGTGAGILADSSVADIVVQELTLNGGVGPAISLTSFVGTLDIGEANLQVVGNNPAILASMGMPVIQLHGGAVTSTGGQSAIDISNVTGGGISLADGMNVFASNLNPGETGVSISAAANSSLVVQLPDIVVDGNLNNGNGVAIAGLGANSVVNVRSITANNVASGVTLNSVSGSSVINALNVTSSGTALDVQSVTNLVVSGATNSVASTSGAAARIIDSSADILLQSAQSTNSAANGILLNNLVGSFIVTDTVAVTNPTGSGILIQNSSANVDIGALGGSTVTVSNRQGTGIDVRQSSGLIRFGNVTIDNTAASNADGLSVSDSAANVVVASATINDANVAVGINNVTGSFELQSGNFSDSTSHSVNITNSSNVTIRNAQIVRAGGHGIHGNGVTNFTFQGNTIIDPADDGIHLTNATGTGVISDNGIVTILSAFDDAIEVSTGVGVTNLTLDSNAITTVVTVDDGIVITAAQGNVTTVISNNQITSVLDGFSDAIVFTGSTSGTLNTTISNNNIQNLFGGFDNAIDLRIQNPAIATTTISGNTIVNSDLINVLGAAVNISVTSTVGSTTTVSNNLINDNGLLQGFDGGIFYTVTNAFTHEAYFTGNTVNEDGGDLDDGIEITVSNGVSQLYVEVLNNVLNGSTGNLAHALNMISNSNATMIAKIEGNLLEATTDIQLTNQAATFFVEDLPNLSANNNNATFTTTGTIQNYP